MPSIELSDGVGDKFSKHSEHDIGLDFDPEVDLEQPGSDSVPSDDEDVEDFSREHYEDVGKSQIRRDPITLGDQYMGSTVPREGLNSDQDEENHFDALSSDSESDGTDESPDGADGAERDGVSDSDDRTSAGDSEESQADLDKEEPGLPMRTEKLSNDREEFKRLIQDQQKGVASSLVESQRADATKGLAVRQQRKAFDSLLNGRIRLQTGLVAMNTMSSLDSTQKAIDATKILDATETAARRLWKTLDDLQTSMQSAKGLETSGKKRKRGDENAGLSSMWEHMTLLEASTQPQRRSNLSRWSERTQQISAKAAQDPTNRLNLSGSAGKTHTLVDVLDAQFASSKKLVERTKIPRTSAPVQAQMRGQRQRDRPTERSNSDTPADRAGLFEEVFDDADFYGMLLKELLEQRQEHSKSNSANTVSNGIAGTGIGTGIDLDKEYRDASMSKTKRLVDTRASKGRKMRYTVHEKLLNFMVPEDRGSWTDKQAQELFSSLFGVRQLPVANGIDNGGEADKVDGEEQALRLFRGR